jgi:hypothetical protein
MIAVYFHMIEKIKNWLPHEKFKILLYQCGNTAFVWLMAARLSVCFRHVHPVISPDFCHYLGVTEANSHYKQNAGCGKRV